AGGGDRRMGRPPLHPAVAAGAHLGPCRRAATAGPAARAAGVAGFPGAGSAALSRCGAGGRAARARGGGMIVFLFNLYLVLLFILVKLKLVPFNLFWKISPLIWLAILAVGLFIPMGWGAPSGPALVIRQSVAIVPDVAGEVTEVPVIANTPLKASDVLFR